MSERPEAYSGAEWRQVPDDVLETALRDAEEYVLDDRPNALEFALCLAIIGERARCAAIAKSWGGTAKKLGQAAEAAIADDIASMIENPAHPGTLTDEAKARRSTALDELGALDGELLG